MHIGDISKIDGAKIPFVDVVTGGSPCQDLSIAGKRAGLAGTRSGLFMEQIRIIKEMQEASGATCPRYMVWENVPGAFSSNKGKDFAAVLEETIRIVEPEAPNIEVPEKGWPTWGCYRDMDGRWSVAWRTLDAQYWGVPQRRRRIALVADFGGGSAPEILFERKSVLRDFETCGKAWEGTAAAAESSPTSADGKCMTPCDVQSRRIFDKDGVWPSLYGGEGGGHGYVANLSVKQYLSENHSQDSRYKGPLDVCPTLPAQLGTGGNNTPFVCIPINDKATRYMGGGNTRNHDGAGNGLGVGHDGDPSPTLTSGDRNGIAVLPFDTTQITSPQNGNKPKYGDPCHPLCAGAHPPTIVGTEMDILCRAHGQAGAETMRNLCPTLNCNHEQPIIAHSLEGFVRRLTPLECERLQGFPDNWTNIGEWYDSQTGEGYWVDSRGKRRKIADSPRYKALGNSIALPPWRFVLGRIYANLPDGATLGSLFDGIGGFPLIWRELGGVHVWASEIEEFCIAVTEKRFNHDAD